MDKWDIPKSFVVAMNAMRSVVTRFHREDLLNSAVHVQAVLLEDRPDCYQRERYSFFFNREGDSVSIVIERTDYCYDWVLVEGSHSLRGVPVELGQTFKLDQNGNIS